MTDPSLTDFALALARVWLGIMIFAHGWRHLAATRSGPGIARWFESLGLLPGPLHAWNVTVTELLVGVALVAGFLTPLAYGGLCSLLLVAAVTNHRKNGFFINNPGEGWEYVVTVAVVAIALGTLGPGNWSLDHAVGFSFPFENGTALLITALLGLGGTAGFLAVFWRPPAEQPS
ncbi:MAG TPA: DoxX family protein [Acidimicrobiia bacterium]|jgi:putative oxidoreductase|nr:DoxX family protein [Acidimicrobiia bacterium]